MALHSSVPLSSKLSATAASGFAVSQSSEPNYRFEWHQHDCAMLLWAQTGALDSRWLDRDLGDLQVGCIAQSRRLVRHTALLLPAHAAHSTRSETPRQRHGELYLRPELLGSRTRWGAFLLDGASLALLDALAAPALAADCVEPLVHVLLGQLASRDLAQRGELATLDALDSPLSHQMLRRFLRALEHEQPLPSVDAVAHELGVSIRRLQRACATELGISPVAVRRRLLARAARELLAQGLTPSRTAQQLGFTHSGHLNRLLHEVPD